MTVDVFIDLSNVYSVCTLFSKHGYPQRIIRYAQVTNSNVTPNVHVYLEKKDTSFITEYYDTPSTAS